MEVRILRLADQMLVSAKIIPRGTLPLPSVTEGWRFNFRRHANRKGVQTFILITEEFPDRIEGCLIFEMKAGIEPFMAYIEIAPHNKTRLKQYDRVAGCLIAFACRLSFIHGKAAYKGWLAFEVLEGRKQDEIKLMSLYSQKYGALRFGETTMVISPEAGEKLIQEFLNSEI